MRKKGIRLKFRKKKENPFEPKTEPPFDFSYFSSTSVIHSYHELKDRLIEQYQHSPEFHALVDSFHQHVRSGRATFDGLFGALLLAKELFVQEHENLREPKEEK